jgi:NAD-dependent dihydropyrimidine dehydrogenase PreA subunit
LGGKKKALAINPNRCVGCMTCMLRCSYKFSGTYCPALAAVSVSGPDPGGGGFNIYFQDKCDGCGICAAFCLYGGITAAGEGGGGQ